jgi:hypothetical protein
MNVMRLHGKIGKHEGIVFIKNFAGSSVWVVQLDMMNPNDLTKAKLTRQVK